MTSRFAIYYAPAAEHPLWAKASAWLGRDAATGADIQHPHLSGLEGLDLKALTEDPRHYGFHATLVAPFELAEGKSQDELLQFAKRFAASQVGFEADIAPAALGSFLAFRISGQSGAIQALHEACVRAFHPFRAPQSEFDLARRRRAPLTAEQDALLIRWGYPYVFSEFRFHMTLTGRIPDETDRACILTALRSYFADVTGPHRFDGIAVFKQDQRDAPFSIVARASFGG